MLQREKHDPRNKNSKALMECSHTRHVPLKSPSTNLTRVFLQYLHSRV